MFNAITTRTYVAFNRSCALNTTIITSLCFFQIVKERVKPLNRINQNQIPDIQCPELKTSPYRLNEEHRSRCSSLNLIPSTHTFNITNSTIKSAQPDQTTNAWWRMTGSNRRPPACKAGALPAELIPRNRSKSYWWVKLESNQRPPPYQDGALTD